MSFTVGIAMALSAAFGVNGSQAAAVIMPMPAAQTVEEYVREYFADIPVMIEVAKCESQFRQFNNKGEVLKNPTSSAVGVFQIMASIHADFADEKLGLDVYNLQGNAAYARYLYEKQGTKPWEADMKSKNCWGKTEAAKAYKAELALNK